MLRYLIQFMLFICIDLGIDVHTNQILDFNLHS